jgi:hypothetical protein
MATGRWGGEASLPHQIFGNKSELKKGSKDTKYSKTCSKRNHKGSTLAKFLHYTELQKKIIKIILHGTCL